MATPRHLDLYHNALIKRVKEHELIGEHERSFFSEILDRTIASTNGRTTEQKIQDITETVTSLAQIAIARELEAKENINNNVHTSEKIDRVSKETDDKINRLADATNEKFDKFAEFHNSDKQQFTADLQEIKSEIKSLSKQLTKNDIDTAVLKEVHEQEKQDKTVSKTPKYEKVMVLISKSWPLAVTIMFVVGVLAFRPALSGFLSKLFGL